MTKIPYNITGFSGVDATSDPFVLGQKDPQMASLAYNYRARKGGIRTVRGGLTEVVTGGAFKRSGMYFPVDAAVVIPYQVLPANYGSCGMMALDAISFTIEFWYRSDFKPYDRVVGTNPYAQDDSSTYTHMHVEMYPVVESSSTQVETGLQFEFLSYEETGSEDIVTGRAYTYESIPTDGDWHHIAIARDGSGDVWACIDAVSYVQMTALNSDTADKVVAPEHVANTDYQVSSHPLIGSCYKMGLDGGSLAEFRMWSDYRTIGEIQANYNVVVDRLTAGLVFYVPFDEATGKSPQEKVGLAYGYMTPSEPYVNDDNELVFNGWDSLAIPSGVAGFTTPFNPTYPRAKYAMHLNDDGAVHGGILWDRCLYSTTTPGDDPNYRLTGNDEDAEDARGYGIYKGTAQIKIKLQQLGEGIIAGRLGIMWIAAASKFGLYFIDTDTTEGVTASPKVYIATTGGSEPGYIDTSWLDTEKVITVIYDGTRATSDRAKMYVDNAEVTLSNAATAYWNAPAGGTNIDAMSGTYKAFNDNIDIAVHTIDGAIGGTPRFPQMGVAFDLVFLRQWWDDHPYADTTATADLDNAALVAATYAVSKLDEKDRIFRERLNTGSDPLAAFGSFGFCYISDLAGTVFQSYRKRMFVVCPTFNILEEDGSPFYGQTDYLGSSQWELGNKNLVKRGVKWNWGYGAIDPDPQRVDFITEQSDFFVIDGNFASNIWTSGFLLSNLVNDLNADTFKYNETERIIFEDGEKDSTPDGDFTCRYRDQKMVNAIVDDSPIQGKELIGGFYYPTRYFELNGGGTTTKSGHTIYNLRSLKPRWCDGPVAYASSFPYVQTLCRYKTEKGDVDKLLALVNSQVWEVDVSDGSCTPLEFGWIGADTDEHVNFSIINNRGIFVGTEDGIKINAKGDMSRLGVERPVHIKFTDIPEVDDMVGATTYTQGVMENGDRIGYTLQYYDEENQAYSGTMPIFKNSNTTIHAEVNISDKWDPPEVELLVYGVADPNITRIRLFKTTDLETTGSESLVYLTADQGMTSGHDEILVYDRLMHTETTSRYQLPSIQYGQDLIPDPGAAMEVAYGRLFIFNVEALASALTWSEVDSLGLAIPDQFPELNAMIIEEGGTTAGKALQKYNNILYAFKDNSIFRINPEAGGTFSSQLVYKGVGALNQRCVQVAGNSMFFMDTNGIYNYTEGEPRLVTVGLTDFFSDEVNQTALPDKAFMIHSKKDDILLSYVPSSGASYCDRCIVLDLRSGAITIDAVPQVTCGYVDDETIYLGTPYGKILQYDPDTFVDVSDSALTGTGEVTTTTLASASVTLPVDDSSIGATAHIVDTTNKRVWSGTITTEESNLSFTVDAWTAVFNATGETPSGTVTFYLGHILVYEKTPILSFPGNALPNVMWGKSLKDVEFLSTGFSALAGMMIKIDLSNDITDVVESLSPSGVEHIHPVVQGMHKGFSMETVFFVSAEFSMRNITYQIEHTKGRHNG